MEKTILKTCSLCKQDKSISEFNKRNACKSGLQNACKKCNREKSRKYYRDNLLYHRKNTVERSKKQKKKNLQFVYSYLQKHPCIDCGCTIIACLDFDHVRGKKKMMLSRMVNSGYSINTIQAEIDKCEVRCANCHRIKTAKDFGWYGKILVTNP